MTFCHFVQAMMTNDSSFEVSTDQTRLDIPMIYRFLSEQSTWAVGISRRCALAAISMGARSRLRA
jgi:hypothetical protein